MPWLPEKLKQARENINADPTQFAFLMTQHMGRMVSVQTVKRWESDVEPRAEFFNAICDVTGMDRKFFFARSRECKLTHDRRRSKKAA